MRWCQRGRVRSIIGDNKKKTASSGLAMPPSGEKKCQRTCMLRKMTKRRATPPAAMPRDTKGIALETLHGKPYGPELFSRQLLKYVFDIFLYFVAVVVALAK